MSSAVARRYAKALFELCQPDVMEPTRMALNEFAAGWSQNSELRGTMLNPALPLASRERALASIAERFRAGDTQLRNLLVTLLRNHRLSLVEEVAKAFGVCVDQYKRLLSLEVTSAFPLSDSERSAMQGALARDLGSGANVEWRVSSDLLGGLTIKAGDKLLDGSVRGALNRARAELLG